MKPSDAFIGVIDLFAVLLPGAVLSFIARAVALALPPDTQLASEVARLDGAAGWIAFLIASYCFGHFVYFAGARLDKLYDQVRSAGLEGDRLLHLAVRIQRQYVARAEERVGSELGKPLRFDAPAPRGAWLRLVGWLTRGTWSLPAPGAASGEVINAFKLAKAVLHLRHPGALAEVQRLEADSKFFRSTVVVLVVAMGTLVARAVLIAVHWLWLGHDDRTVLEFLVVVGVDVALIAACLLALRLAFAYYCERRYKATELAYQLVVACVALGEDGGADELPVPRAAAAE